MPLVDERSPAEALADLPPDERRARVEQLASGDIDALYRSWRFWRRPKQTTPPGRWRWWVVSAGRGFGKNRVGSEWTCERAEQFAAARRPHLIGLVNATYGDVRAVQVGGESGLRAVCDRRGHQLDIGATAVEGRLRVWDEGWQDSTLEVHTADQPERARGRNFHTVNMDELSKWKQKIDGEGGTAFTNVDLGLRALCPPGLVPQGIVTMTPKPTKLVRDLLASEYGDTVVTRGSMFENRANLAVAFVEAILRRYVGTRLGAQEIEGVLLDNVEGALWKAGDIELARHRGQLDVDLIRVVVGVDPPGGLRTECGIVVAGWGWGADGLPHLYVLDDYSVAGAPDVWAPKVIDAAAAWQADTVVAETNYGGLMVRDVLQVRAPLLPVEMVQATRGKAIRAEPVADLWTPKVTVDEVTPGRGHMVGFFGDLEGELTTWVPGDPVSPNRLDALVWCGHALLPGLASVDSTVAYGSSVADARL